MRNQQNVKVKVNSTFETICPFPVGYMYASFNNTSPADIYGGTWSSVTGGKYIRAAEDTGSGGSSYISISQLPTHTHGTPMCWSGSGSQTVSGARWVYRDSGTTTAQPTWYTYGAGGGKRFIQHIRMYMFGTELLRFSNRVEVI